MSKKSYFFLGEHTRAAGVVRRGRTRAAAAVFAPFAAMPAMALKHAAVAETDIDAAIITFFLLFS